MKVRTTSGASKFQNLDSATNGSSWDWTQNIVVELHRLLLETIQTSMPLHQTTTMTPRRWSQTTSRLYASTPRKYSAGNFPRVL